MAELTIHRASPGGTPESKPKLDAGFNPMSAIIFFGLLAAGLLFTAYSLYDDLSATNVRITTWVPFLLLGVALLVALGFEFVNGFHDTANAVATVIYTHALPPQFAVVWSCCQAACTTFLPKFSKGVMHAEPVAGSPSTGAVDPALGSVAAQAASCLR